ncbi:KDO2-lipid IV(A) lauroyltransferase [Herbihabitans rhizosphaerae]|uniref:KDO2-lipid IV(A) lauroyltransferase n=1 Tax=Herbihabitans rhizosphaerae TaxID=1872711 RepID=A0A4Q7KHJ1_9PSEU|nr:phosphatidylinositol mannoside acyltransferase [Herbihabitans rhizosphaerae]RZS34380.1 KDO2-lipid IV(A) lauroyltransferase [Herbihabitans rhizosphaerae]
MSDLQGRLKSLGFRVAWRTQRVLPEKLVWAVCRYAADRAARKRGPGTEQLRRNLARVVPAAGEVELDDLVREGLRSYARYWMEVFRMPLIGLDGMHRKVDPHVYGRENLDAALAKGNGAIVALTHSGNWEVLGGWVAAHTGHLATVAERLQPESLYRRFTKFRESLGMEVVPHIGGDQSAATVMAQCLRDNKSIALLGDRDLTSSGIPVTFFGERTRMPAGPAYLAARTGAALIPLGLWNTEDGWAMRFHPPIKVDNTKAIGAATQALADVFAADIAAHPTDWHMLQKLWVADLPEEEQAALAAKDAVRGRKSG